MEENGIRLRLKNVGEIAGSEIVQMYVALPDRKIERPEKELKGFAKVYLEAGEEKEVCILFDDKTFRVFDEEAGMWVEEAGTYRIFVGSSSQDIHLAGEIFQTGLQKDGQHILEVPGSKTQIWKTRMQACKMSGMGENTGNPVWNGYKVLQANDPLSDMRYAKNPVARYIAKMLKNKIEKAEENGQTPDLNTLFQYNMPFRAIAKMTGGMVSAKMVDGLLLAVNGKTGKGLVTVIFGFFENWKANKAYAAILAQQEKTGGEEGEL